MRIGVVGGGITGLAAAYFLTKQGHQVVVFEKNTYLGGAGWTFATPRDRLECFYHHFFEGDHHLLELLGELGLSSRLVRATPMTSIYYNEALHPFSSPLDILNFTPLGLVDRWRVGAVSAVLKYALPWHGLVSTTARSWCRRWFGSEGTKVIWDPLLTAKFGQYADQIVMSWLWARIKARSFKLYYLDGSLQLLFDALQSKIQTKRGQVRVGAEVREIVRENDKVEVHGDFGEERFDRVLGAIAFEPLLNLATFDDPDYVSRARSIKFLSATILILKTKHILTDYYWTNLNQPGFPFLALVEQANLVSKAHYGGYNYVYLGNYFSPEDVRLSWSAEKTFQQYLPFIRKVNPEFEESWVEELYKFTAPFAQPVVDIGYRDRLPGLATPLAGLYCANIAHIYPWDRGINYSVKLAERAAREVATDQNA